MKTSDLPLADHLKWFVKNLEEKTLWRINDGLEVRGETHYAFRSDYHTTTDCEHVQSTLIEINADCLIILMVENNKGEDFKAGGTINIHVYTPERSFEGYTDLCWSEEGARVAAPMEWQAFEGSMGYFK
ncbi:hypothetical protein [Ralstonia mannitolilytica]|uniref:hypothetical protein n=1 Tax=Ralstonia mannitolilytica TaxID=105219 RepID=UPI00292E66F1|nr:hypothetical protein [Ralstonia mannitolilytica]